MTSINSWLNTPGNDKNDNLKNALNLNGYDLTSDLGNLVLLKQHVINDLDGANPRPTGGEIMALLSAADERYAAIEQARAKAQAEAEAEAKVKERLLHAESRLQAIRKILKKLKVGQIFSFWRKLLDINDNDLANLSAGLQEEIFLYCGLDFYLSFLENINDLLSKKPGLMHLYPLRLYIHKLLCKTPITQIELFYVGDKVNWVARAPRNVFVTRLIVMTKLYELGDSPCVKRLALAPQSSIAIRGYLRLDAVTNLNSDNNNNVLCSYTVVAQQVSSIVREFIMKLQYELGFAVASVNDITMSRWFKSFYIIKGHPDAVMNAKALNISVYEETPPPMGCYYISPFPTSKKIANIVDFQSQTSDSVDMKIQFMSVVDDVVANLSEYDTQYGVIRGGGDLIRIVLGIGGGIGGGVIKDDNEEEKEKNIKAVELKTHIVDQLLPSAKMALATFEHSGTQAAISQDQQYEPFILQIINAMAALEELDVALYSQILANPELQDIEIAYGGINSRFTSFAEETDFVIH